MSSLGHWMLKKYFCRLTWSKIVYYIQYMIKKNNKNNLFKVKHYGSFINGTYIVCCLCNNIYVLRHDQNHQTINIAYSLCLYSITFK